MVRGMTTTLRIVAEACGIDISTVSRALRGDARVAAATAAHIKAVAERLGYRPNLAARALQAGATRTMWLIAGNLESLFERRLASETASAIEPTGYDLLIASHHDQATTFDHLCGRLEQGVTDAALIIAPNGAMPASAALERLIARRWPLMFLDRSPGNDQYPTVTSDNAGMSRDLIQRLAANGAQRVVLFRSADNAVASTRQRAALAEAQRLQLDVCIDARPAWLAADRRPLAVFATSQSEVHAFCMQHAEHLRDTRLTAAVFDSWVGEPHPLQSIEVAVQDFSGLAARAAQRVRAVIEHPETWSAANEQLPPLRIERIEARF